MRVQLGEKIRKRIKKYICLGLCACILMLNKNNVYAKESVEPKGSNNISKILDDNKASFVALESNGDKKTYKACGFVLTVANDGVYICTNKHVLEKSDDWNVYFSDGSNGQGQIVGMSSRFDVGLIWIEYIDILEQSNTDKNRVHHLNDEKDDIDVKPVDIDYSKWLEHEKKYDRVGYLCLNNDGSVKRQVVGTILNLFEYFELENHTYINTSLRQRNGESGSAVLDKDGKLVGMVYGTTDGIYGSKELVISLQDIMDASMEILNS